MKKSLLSTIAATVLTIGAIAQQVPSPFWSTVQNSNFPVVSAGIRYFDAVDANVVWGTGYDGTAVSRNYNWYTMTTNGGATFTSGNIFPDTNTYVLSNIEGMDASNAWVSAYKKATGDQGVVYHTTNGGTTWTNGGNAGMFSTAGQSFADFVTFVTPTVGVAVGDPKAGEFEIYRTTNGGTTWSAVAGSVIPNPLTGEYGLTDSYTKYGANNIWFGTNKGRVYHSNDAGQTWNVGATGATADVTSLAFRDAMNGLVLGYTGTVVALYSTTNGGSTWTSVPLDPNMGKNDIAAIPGTTWYGSCGAGTGNYFISYSFDDGLTWNSWGGTNIQYLKLDFVNNSVGWAGSFSNNLTVGVGGIYQYSGLPLGVNTVSSLAPKAIEMYPNPSNGNVTINLLAAKEGATINVIDMMGKVVYTENVKTTSFEKHNMNLEHLAKGIYYVNVSQGNEKYSQKITIQ